MLKGVKVRNQHFICNQYYTVIPLYVLEDFILKKIIKHEFITCKQYNVTELKQLIDSCTMPLMY